MAKNVYSPEELEKYYRLRELRKKREAKEKPKEEKPKAGPKPKKRAVLLSEKDLKHLKEEEWPDWAIIEKRKHRYWIYYNHKNVKITLLNNMELTGKLHADFTNPYDVQLEIENGKRLLIPKHAIAIVEEL